MKISVLWVVEFPKAKSTITDILTRTTIRGFALQIKGGLCASDIHSVWTDEAEGIEVANMLLRRRDDVVAKGEDVVDEVVSDATIRAYCEALQ